MTSSATKFATVLFHLKSRPWPPQWLGYLGHADHAACATWPATMTVWAVHPRQSHLNHGRKQAGDGGDGRCFQNFQNPQNLFLFIARRIPLQAIAKFLSMQLAIISVIGMFHRCWNEMIRFGSWILFMCRVPIQFLSLVTGLMPISSNSLGSWFPQVSVAIVPWISKKPAQKISEI